MPFHIPFQSISSRSSFHFTSVLSQLDVIWTRTRPSHDEVSDAPHHPMRRHDVTHRHSIPFHSTFHSIPFHPSKQYQTAVCTFKECSVVPPRSVPSDRMQLLFKHTVVPMTVVPHHVVMPLSCTAHRTLGMFHLTPSFRFIAANHANVYSYSICYTTARLRLPAQLCIACCRRELSCSSSMRSHW